MLNVGVVMDESAKFDGYNWHDIYYKEFEKIGDFPVLLDFKSSSWKENLKKNNFDLIIWRAWHRPDDKNNAKEKIYFINKFLKTPIYPSYSMYVSYDNKNLQYEILKELGFKQPESYIFRKKEEAIKFTKKATFPIVAKSSEGACGDNVYLMNNKEELSKYIDDCFDESGKNTYFPSVKQFGYVYLQEFIKTNRDLRIITIGDKVELAFWRENNNFWKKNVWTGATINPYNVPGKAKEIALNLAKKLDFHWCAIDLIEKDGEFFILEFSSIFGFSSKEEYIKHFGSENANILKKQVKYLHNLHIKNG